VGKLHPLSEFAGEPAFTGAGGADHADSAVWEKVVGVHSMGSRVAYYNQLEFADKS
jgi:hypothetical protein